MTIIPVIDEGGRSYRVGWVRRKVSVFLRLKSETSWTTGLFVSWGRVFCGYLSGRQCAVGTQSLQEHSFQDRSLRSCFPWSVFLSEKELDQRTWSRCLKSVKFPAMLFPRSTPWLPRNLTMLVIYSRLQFPMWLRHSLPFSVFLCHACHSAIKKWGIFFHFFTSR